MASPGKFASGDFFSICDAKCMSRTAASKQIRALLQENKIEHAGYRQRQGIRGLPLYKVVKEAVKPGPPRKEPETLKGSADRYYALLSEKEKRDKLCADRLEAAMRGWV